MNIECMENRMYVLPFADILNVLNRKFSVSCRWSLHFVQLIVHILRFSRFFLYACAYSNRIAASSVDDIQMNTQIYNI